MRAGCRHQQGALGSQLALDLRQVRVGQGLPQQALRHVGLQRGTAIQVRGDLQQVLDGNHLEARRQAGLFGVGLWHQQGAPGIARGQRRRQNALDGAHGAGQRQLAEAFVVGDGRTGYLAAGGENAQRDGQVEATAILRQVGGCQVEGTGKCHITDEQGIHIVRTMPLD